MNCSIQKWTILFSKYILKTKWLTVRQDKIRTSTGEEVDDYYVLEYPDWINVLAITEDGLFIIERQYRHGTQTIDYELCAGTVEKGENPLETAKRELLEETGYYGGSWELYCVSTPNPAAMTNINYSYLAKGVQYSGNRYLEKTEDIEIVLMDYQELKKIIKNGEIKQGQMLAPLWKYIAENPEIKYIR